VIAWYDQQITEPRPSAHYELFDQALGRPKARFLPMAGQITAKHDAIERDRKIAETGLDVVGQIACSTVETGTILRTYTEVNIREMQNSKRFQRSPGS
jgi:hypothetical protein